MKLDEIFESGLWLWIAFLIFTSCGKSEVPSPDGGRKPLPLPKAERTVLAYVVGDNGQGELSSLLMNNVLDMQQGMTGVDTDRFRLVVYSEMASDFPHLIYMRREKDGTVVMDTVVTYPERNPLEKGVMKDVFASVMENFPADEYGLAFLSHSTSWLPARNDANGPMRSLGMYRLTEMNVTDFKEAIAESFEKPLKFVLFDSCLMFSVEVAYELKEVVDFLVGSPLEIPGPGAPYKVVVPAFFAETDPAIEVGRQYFEVYRESYEKPSDGWYDGVAIGVADCRKLSELAARTRQVLGAFSENCGVDRRLTLRYDYSSSEANRDFEDLMALVTGGRESDEYLHWKESFDAAIPFWRFTPTVYSAVLYWEDWSGRVDMTGADGLSCYIPFGEAHSVANRFMRSLRWYGDAEWRYLDVIR